MKFMNTCLRTITAAVILGSSGIAGASAERTDQAPALLSGQSVTANMKSSFGSGAFGKWFVDEFGLPAYRYHPSTAGKGNTHKEFHTTQVGNDNITAFGFAEGFMQLYSFARLMQWTNSYDAAHRQYSGGFGYLRTPFGIISTLPADRPHSGLATRTFGVGYYSKSLEYKRVKITDTVYAPYGDDPVLLHEITIANLSNAPISTYWFEYWGVNPVVPASGKPRGLEAAALDKQAQVLAIRQAAGPDREASTETPVVDSNPYTVVAAPVQGRTDEYETSARAFFGDGSRATPAAVALGKLSNTLVAAVPQGTVGDDMLGFRAPIKIPAHRSATLRFVYGFAGQTQAHALVEKYRRKPLSLMESAAKWRQALPSIDLGSNYSWVAREVVWSAYFMRSAADYEAVCGYHTITQGGYYQYEIGYNWGTRSWTHYILPIIYLYPSLARDILRYTTHLQPFDSYLLPYGTGSLCTRSSIRGIGTPNDSDVWLLFAAAQYGLLTRDTSFFKEQIPFYGGSHKASVWQHLKLAFRHQQSLLGPHGGYRPTPDGGTDWSDGLSRAAGQNESLLVTAQAAYTYPILSALAKLLHDDAFASEVGEAAAAAKSTMEDQWTKSGWYARGFAADKTIGTGILFEEAQPWSILSGVPTRSQVNELVSNMRRYLLGIGAPPALNGPSRIGSAQVPARVDPDVTETCNSYDFTPGGGFIHGAGGCWLGGNWFDLNGDLVWALTSLDGETPHAAEYAWDEYLRNSLAMHADVFPDRWDGITNTDDVCASYYDLKNQGLCGLHLVPEGKWKGQNAEQPTWMTANLLKLAGLSGDETGYTIDPHLPLKAYAIKFPTVGVAADEGVLRGFFCAAATARVLVKVHLPQIAKAAQVKLWIDGNSAAVQVKHTWAQFAVRLRAGKTTDWAIRY